MNLNIKLVIFSVVKDRLKVFLTALKLPSGRLIPGQTLDNDASRIFRKSVAVSLSDLYFEQLYTFSAPYDKREIAVVYYFLVPEHKIYSNKGNWVVLNDIKTNKNDKEIILYAVQRLRWKIEYTNVVYSLLPDEFTFSQLQSIYEAILDKSLDKRNFRKKILSLEILKDTGRKKKMEKGRAAEMFAFRKRELTFVKILQPSS